jgi:hypothetical protein
MSKETRTVRPFTGIAEIEGILDEALVDFGLDTCLANGSLIVDLPAREFLVRPVVIQWAADQAAFEDFRERLKAGARNAGIELADLEMVIVASTPFLKVADVVFAHALGQLDELEQTIDLTATTRSAAFSAPYSGFRVDAYVLLARDLPPKLLRPHLRGTWLAWSQFRVDTTQGPAVLPPTALTAEVRNRLGLLPRTVKFLDFGDHEVIEPYGQQEQPIFYVDEKLLAQLNARRTSPASKALQLQLALDFVSAVIRRASATTELDDMSYEDVRSSLLGNVVRIAAGPGATDQDRNRLVIQVRTDTEKVIARAEHFIDLIAGYGGIIEDGEE